MANPAESKAGIGQNIREKLEAEQYQDQQRRDKALEAGSKVCEY